MLYAAAVLFLLATALAAPPEKRQSCPDIHAFGARETTVSPGYGSSAAVINLLKGAYPGATSEAINYPACGGQASCGGVSYANSVVAGIQAVAQAVNSFNSRCPDTQLVLVGYSQASYSLGRTRPAVRLGSNQQFFCRVDKSWTMPSVEAEIPMKVIPIRPSRCLPPQ